MTAGGQSVNFRSIIPSHTVTLINFLSSFLTCESYKELPGLMDILKSIDNALSILRLLSYVTSYMLIPY